MFGVSLSDDVVEELLISSASKTMSRCRNLPAVKAEAAATSPVQGRKGTVIVSGAPSGLGLATAKAAVPESGKWHIIMACRDFLKAEKAAKSATGGQDGLLFISQLQGCHLGHLLLARLLLDGLKQSNYPSKRLIILGSITEGYKYLARNVPPKADLGDLRELQGGLNGINISPMIDGVHFNGITFASRYPGCIATTGLLREHISLSRLLFPPFQKFITKGFVSEVKSGKRPAQVVSDPTLTKSGAYWSWNKDSASFKKKLSKEASDVDKAKKVREISEKLVGMSE